MLQIVKSVLRTPISTTCAVLVGLSSVASAKLMDNGVDSANLGKGDWIYFMSMATNKLGGHVNSVTNIPSLMSYEKNQGMSFIVVKAGEGSTNFPTSGAQFNSNLVYQAHAVGLKIFGYTRSYGVNINGEIAIATNAMKLGADGFVIDAEVEWESQNLANGPALATQYCDGIKAVYPNRFLGHAPMPIISLHSSFPYKEFGVGCDAVMPQDYWYDMGYTPAAMVDKMDTEWRSFYNSLNGSDTNAIKPIAPIGQADSTNVPGADITAFFTALNNDVKCVTPGGYRGVSFWRSDLHTTAQWSAMKTNALTGMTSNDGNITIDNPSATVVGTWTTASSATDKFGADYRYKGMGTGASYLQYTPNISSPGNYQIYEWHTQGGNRSAGTPHIVTYNGGTANLPINQMANGGKWNLLGTFNLISGSAGNVRITDGFTDSTQIALADAIKFLPVPADIILDNASASLVGSWTTGTSATDKYGASYYYKGPGTGAASCQFVPNLAANGTYQVYEWHTAGGNRAVDAKFRVNNGNTGASQNFVINQTVSGGTWNLLGSFTFSQGTCCTVSVSDSFTTGSVVVADAVKLVFVNQ